MKNEIDEKFLNELNTRLMEKHKFKGVTFPELFFLCLFVLKVTGFISVGWFWIVAIILVPFVLYMITAMVIFFDLKMKNKIKNKVKEEIKQLPLIQEDSK